MGLSCNKLQRIYRGLVNGSLLEQITAKLQGVSKRVSPVINYSEFTGASQRVSSVINYSEITKG